MTLAGRLLRAPFQTSEMDPRMPEGGLLPGEEPAVARAVDKRRREFAAGRRCARRAMAALGEPPRPIPQGEDRAPVWPEGLVGSITHADRWCAAAVARTADGVRAVGIDVEPVEPISLDLVRIICVAEERSFLAAQAAAHQGVLARLIFSAKEAAFKCQYALSRAMLSYHAMQVRLDVEARVFTATFMRDAGPFRKGDQLQGAWLEDHGHVMTAVALGQ